MCVCYFLLTSIIICIIMIMIASTATTIRYDIMLPSVDDTDDKELTELCIEDTSLLTVPRVELRLERDELVEAKPLLTAVLRLFTLLLSELSAELMPDTWLAVARPVLTVNAEKSILITPETFPSTITEYTPVE